MIVTLLCGNLLFVVGNKYVDFLDNLRNTYLHNERECATYPLKYPSV